MKTILLGVILTSFFLLTGCSGGGDSTSESTTIKVERGPILGAIVVDADGQIATQDDNSSASYTFATDPVYPITVYGGFIDVDRSGTIDAGEVENTILLKAESGEVVTLLTTMLSSADENSTSFFLDDLGLNSALTPSEDLNISALSDVMYQYLIDNNIADASDINITDMEQLKDLIKLKIEEYEGSDLNATEHEIILVLELDIKKLDDGEADEANKRIGGLNAIDVITNLPEHVMSVEQKEHVIAMISKHLIRKGILDAEESNETVVEDGNETIEDELEVIAETEKEAAAAEREAEKEAAAAQREADAAEREAQKEADAAERDAAKAEREAARA